jgi:hypothetical protein
MKVIFLILFSLVLITGYAQNLKISDYFKINENEVLKFKSTWVIGSEKKIIKIPPPKRSENMAPAMEPDLKDTIFSNFKVIHKRLEVDGHHVFYAINAEDSLEADPYIDASHFLSSAMIFQNGSVLLAPAHKLSQIKKLKYSDFKVAIPATIAKTDSIFISQGKKMTTLYDFKIITIKIGNVYYNKCLTFTIKEDYPEITYFAQVWLDKKYGVLKWIRTTARTETRVL